MKRILLTLVLMMFTVLTYAQTIGIIGSFNNWSGDINMSTNDNVNWTLTHTFDANSELKFRQNASWDVNWGSGAFPSGNAVQNGNNIPVPAGTYTISFNSSSGAYNFQSPAPIVTYDVTFSVDMSQYPGSTSAGVYLNGTFNNWCGSCNPMTNMGNGIWQVTLPLTAASIEYKFTVGGWDAQENLTSGNSCTVTNFGYTNRSYTVASNAVIPTVCWNSCSSCQSAPSTYNTTFSVDMSQYTGSTANGVFVNGTFNGWCGSCNPMTDMGNGIWQTTLPLPAGSIEYKFTVDGWNNAEQFAGGESCTVTTGGFTNRSYNISAVSTIPTVCWNSCSACQSAPSTYNTTFSVDMSQYIGSTANGVFVNGTFNGWCGNCNPMTDMGNGIWQTTLPLPAGSIEYKFTVDGWNNAEQFAGGESCTVTTGGFTNRSYNISAVSTIPTVCWNSCSACQTAPSTYNTTFSVDMSQYTGSTANGVFVNGTFNGWCGSCNPMTDMGNGIWQTTLPLPAGSIEYKFTVDGWGAEENLTSGTSCTVTAWGYTNRSYTVASNAVIPTVCWNSCSSCQSAPSTYNTTFSVNMSQYTGSTANGVFVNGTFNGWCGSCNPMTNMGNGIWQTTIPLPAGSIEYKFTVDGWGAQENLTSGTSCTVTAWGYTNRSYTVASNAVIPTVCWNSCSDCIPCQQVAISASQSSSCAGQSVTLTASGANSYIWNDGTTGSVKTVAPTSSTVYSVVGSGPGNCSSSSNISISVIPAPVLTTNTNIICTGVAVIITSSVSNGLSWQKSTTANGTYTTIAGQTASTYSPTTAGFYRAVSSQCPNSYSSAQQITTGVITTGTTTASAVGSSSACVGGSVTLSATTSVTNPTYQWYKSTTAVAGATSQTLTLSPMSTTLAGSYNVKVAASGQCLSAASNSVAVTSNAAPAAATVSTVTAGASPILCGTGGSLAIKSSVAPVAGTTSLQWFLNGTAITGATTQNYTATAAGTYTVQVTNAAGCSVMSAGFNITQGVVPSTPVVSVTAGNTLLCGTATVTLTSSVPAVAGTTTLAWYKGGVLIAGATGTTYTIAGSTTAAGSYTVVATQVGGCASAVSNAIAVTYSAAPAAATVSTVTAGASPILCGTGGSLAIKSSVAPVAGTTSLQWFLNGTAITGATTQNYTATATGTYTVQVTNAAGCSVMSAGFVITQGVVASTPVVSVTAGNTLLCGTATVTLTSSVPAVTGTTTLAWYKGGVLIAGATGTTYTITGSTTAAGSYTVVATQVGGCASAVSNAIAVTYSAAPAAATVSTVTAGASAILCGSPASLAIKSSVAPVTGTTSLQWFLNGTAITGATAQNYTATAAGTYTVKVTNAAGCSVMSAGFVITQGTVATAPVVTATTTSMCGASTVSTTLTSSIAPVTGTTLQWQKDGVNIASAIAQTRVVTNTHANSGSYRVVRTQTGFCPSTSNAVAITTGTAATAAPTVSTVTSLGTATTNTVLGSMNPTIYLKSSIAPVTGTATVAPVALKWYKNGVEINPTTNQGSTNQTIAVTTAGSYTVKAFYGTAQCAGVVSAAKVITGTSPLGIMGNTDVVDRADAQERLDVELTWDAAAMPNPYNEYVTVSLSTESTSSVTITMVDAMGKEVSRTQTTVEGVERVQLGEQLTPGVYMITVRQDENVEMIRVIKQ